MSTPANIADLSKDGQLYVINDAMDGYPEEAGAGNVLLNAYNDPKKVHQLMKLGNVAHVGFTPKAANVYKEAGSNWSEYTGIGSTISGHDYKGRYTSPKTAMRNQKKQDKWFQSVDNYTHAFQRDWGRGHSEQGTSSTAKYPDVQSAMLDMQSKAQYESEYNYIFDEKNNHWYVNNQSDTQIHSLSDVVPKHDRQVIHQEYVKFQRNPENPKLPKIGAPKIHQMIDKAINNPNMGLKSQLKMDKGTLQVNQTSVKNAKRALKLGGLSTGHRLQLQQTVRVDSDPVEAKRLNKNIHRETAQIKNLNRIDKYLTAHPNTKMYPNDLKLGSSFSKQIQHPQQSVSNDFGHFFSQHPAYSQKMNYYSGNQAKVMFHRRNETYRKGLSNPKISNQILKPMIANNVKASQLAQPNKIYSGEQIDSVELQGTKAFKPVGYGDFKQNVHALAPHDKKLHKLLAVHQPKGQSHKGQTVHFSKSDMSRINQLIQDKTRKSKQWNNDVNAVDKGRAKKSRSFRKTARQMPKHTQNRNRQRHQDQGPSMD